MCKKCLLMHTEIGEDIEPTASITMCKECGKWASRSVPYS